MTPDGGKSKNNMSAPTGGGGHNYMGDDILKIINIICAPCKVKI